MLFIIRGRQCKYPHVCVLHRSFSIVISCLLYLLVIATNASGNDTIRVMGYNLLNYGASNNTTSYKNPRLSTILDHIQPDILGVNELVSSPVYALSILEQVLGQDWEKGAFQSSGYQSLTSTVFWKSTKFSLKRQVRISQNVRDITAYRLYYKDEQLAQTRDTTFLTVIMVHLKAGNNTDDQRTRAEETRSIVNYLNSIGGKDNYLLMGDMNLYSSAEEAYTNLINSPDPASRFYDPVDSPGDWNESQDFAHLHTQSTRRSSQGDGGAFGGLDDRFDFILASGSVMDNESGVGYIPGSYTTVGQDGKRLNNSVNSRNPPNLSAPAHVIEALYEMSDHLPVYADFVVKPLKRNQVPGIRDDACDLYVVNPVADNIEFSFCTSNAHRDVTIHLTDLTGQFILTEKQFVSQPGTLQTLTLPHRLLPGIYVLTVTNSHGQTIRKKLLKH